MLVTYEKLLAASHVRGQNQQIRKYTIIINNPLVTILNVLIYFFGSIGMLDLLTYAFNGAPIYIHM
jgi:hypothetical protein